MESDPIERGLQERVTQALGSGQALCIQGGGTKRFYGRRPVGTRLDIGACRGILCYEPTELVISARTGTPLREVEQVLAGRGQMLGFEPPHYGEGATLGGTIACNLSGPRRVYAGAARDFVLGIRMLNGHGEILSFGGRVMKNVAGYDVSRLMTGALGTLGVLLQVYLKVLPRPEREITLARGASAPEALEAMHAWARHPLPISASCFDGESLLVRLSGAAGAVESARRLIGGEILGDSERFWRRLREHRHRFFETPGPLWRLALASDAPPIEIPGKWLYEWGGGLRWLVSDSPAAVIRREAQRAGGQAMAFRGHDGDNVFHPLPETLLAVHRQLKHAFDPSGILNPGRMYRDL